MPYAEVAVAVPVDHLYTYQIPEELVDDASEGKRVLIPFRKRYMTGYVVRLSDTTDVANIRNIADVLDTEPVITPDVLQLTQWIADYYLCPWGLVMKAALPSGLDIVHDMLISLENEPAEIFQYSERLVQGKVQKKVLAALRQHSSLTLRELQKKIGKKGLYAALHALEHQQLIHIEQMATEGKVKPKTLQHVTLRHSPERTREET